jgi:hypothetical protein
MEWKAECRSPKSFSRSHAATEGRAASVSKMTTWEGRRLKRGADAGADAVADAADDDEDDAGPLPALRSPLDEKMVDAMRPRIVMLRRQDDVPNSAAKATGLVRGRS